MSDSKNMVEAYVMGIKTRILRTHWKRSMKENQHQQLQRDWYENHLIEQSRMCDQFSPVRMLLYDFNIITCSVLLHASCVSAVEEAYSAATGPIARGGGKDRQKIDKHDSRTWSDMKPDKVLLGQMW